MTIEQINLLVEKYPNDMELGEAVRQLYWTYKQGKVLTNNPNQTKLFDIPVHGAELLDNDDVAILGED
tara:strand:- start:2264 stop:2467 length:204 start_codon:yes stop_codon:yes gene_type:complete